MKITKFLSLSLAAVVSIQSIAGAQSRVDGIGDSQIQVAQSEMKSIKLQLLEVDRALQATEYSIKMRDKNGKISNAIAIGTAGLGLAAGVLAAKLLKLKGPISEGALIEFEIRAPLAAILTIGSAAAGIKSAVSKPTVQVQQVITDLQRTQSVVSSEISMTSDMERKKTLEEMNQALTETMKSLAKYEQNQSSTNGSLVMAHFAQFFGGLLIIGGIAGSNTVFALGGIIGGAGNVGRMALGFKTSQSEAILSEIVKARLQIQLAFEQL